MMNIETIYIKYLLELITIDELIESIKLLTTSDNTLNQEVTKELLKIVFLNTKTDEKFQANEILEKVIKNNFPDFECNKEFYAQDILKNQCKQLLEDKITPYQFSQIISPLEGIFDYPKWLGDLYNVFDWCDETTKINTYIISEVNNIIEDLE